MESLKKISIKLSTIKRYNKDINYYEKELQGLRTKFDSIQSDPEACPHVLKKQEELLKETESMIPECENRLQAAKADLQDFLTSHSDIENIINSDIFKEAQSFLS